MKKSNPLISVIIPFFNQTEFLEEAIKSIYEQTSTDFEILIVDDCSTDPAAKKLLKTLKNVKVLHTPKNSGPAVARNLGAKHARGKFVCFLDADDKFDRTFLEKSLMILEKKSDVDFVYSFIQHFDKDDQIHPTLSPYNFFSLLFRNQLPYAALIRREAFEDVKGYNGKLNKNESEDWDFWIRMGKNNHFGYCIEEPLFYYRKAENKRLKNVQSHYAQIVQKLRRRHSDLYQMTNLLKLWWKWSNTKKQKKSWADLGSRTFHMSPKFLQKVILKFHEAELLETENWKTAPTKCAQLMIPISWRKKINTTFGKTVFPEKTKFSDIAPVINISASLDLEKKLKIPQKNKKTVLIFLPWVPMGGVETVMLHVLRKLHKNFNFVLLTTEKSKNSLHTSFAQYAAVYHLPNLFSFKKEKIQFIFQKIESLKIQNIFIVNSLFAFKLIPTLKNKFPKISISTSLHGWDKNFDFLSVAALYFPFLTSVICVSNSVKKQFEKKLGEKSDRVKVIENVLDYELLEKDKKQKCEVTSLHKKDEHQKNVIFLGRYNFDKNPHLFVDLANFFLTDLELTDFRFFLFGEGPDEKSLLRRAKDINARAGEKIVFVEKRQTNIASLYKQADVLVNCSPREGFGMSALEAMYFGVRVVGFDLEVFTEILPEKYFFPVSQNDSRPLPIFGKQIFKATERNLTPSEKEKLKEWVQKRFPENGFSSAYKDVFKH